MSYALQFEKDVLFLDSDILILNEINEIDNTKELNADLNIALNPDKDEILTLGYINPKHKKANFTFMIIFCPFDITRIKLSSCHF